MLTDKQLAQIEAIYQARMQEVTDVYLQTIGAHLKQIGTLSASDIHKLKELRRAGMNMNDIKRAVVKATGQSIKEVNALFKAVAAANESFADLYYPTATRNRDLLKVIYNRIISAQAKQTQDTLLNLSRTTLSSNSLRQLAADGLRVQYPSGLTRRLDSAVRQNVLDGARQVQAEIMQQVGEAFGADGVEISAHSLCAEDHLPYQGKQYTWRHFERVQQALKRPIGEWNCRHVVFPIIRGVSPATHTYTQLEKYKAASQEAITIDGKTRSRYAWTQEQRRLETAVRQQKDIRNAAKAAGDDVLRREAQGKIRELQAQYTRVSEGAGLIEAKERMGVISGRAATVGPVKPSPPKPVPPPPPPKPQALKYGTLESTLSKKQVADMDALLKAAPEEVRRAWNFHVDDVKFAGLSATSDKYNAATRRIHYNQARDQRPTDYAPKYNTIFHEIGHSLDFGANLTYGNKNYFQGISETFKGGVFGRTIREEINAMLGDFAYANVLDTLRVPTAAKLKQIALKDASLADLIGRYQAGAVTAQDLFRNKLFLENYLPQTSRETLHVAFAKSIKAELSRVARADLSDIFESEMLIGYPFDVGHGRGYWNNRDVSKEAFAEMFAAEITTPESLEAIKQYLPKSYQIFKDILEVIR